MTLSDADRARIEGLDYDPDADVAFNDIGAYLVWSDEVPSGLTPAGSEYLRDLLGARGFIHRGVPIEDWDRGWTDRAERWNEALAEGLRWPGFRRIALMREHRLLLDRRFNDTSVP